jgi:hypothetical protein
MFALVIKSKLRYNCQCEFQRSGTFAWTPSCFRGPTRLSRAFDQPSNQPGRQPDGGRPDFARHRQAGSSGRIRIRPDAADIRHHAGEFPIDFCHQQIGHKAAQRFVTERDRIDLCESRRRARSDSAGPTLIARRYFSTLRDTRCPTGTSSRRREY